MEPSSTRPPFLEVCFVSSSGIAMCILYWQHSYNMPTPAPNPNLGVYAILAPTFVFGCLQEGTTQLENIGLTVSQKMGNPSM
jgi:hypothetical protein